MKMETNNNFELQEAFDLFDTDGDGQVIEFVFIEFCSQTFKWHRSSLLIWSTHFRTGNNGGVGGNVQKIMY